MEKPRPLNDRPLTEAEAWQRQVLHQRYGPQKASSSGSGAAVNSQAEPAGVDNASPNGTAESAASVSESGEEDKLPYAGAVSGLPTAKVAPLQGSQAKKEEAVRLVGFTRTNLDAYKKAPVGTYLFHR